jgi:NTE family protein
VSVPAASGPNGGDGRSVALVLGSGGARGLAHIGVIEVLEARGFRVRAIAGSSMGALVGGIHAAGKLREYAAWVRALQRMDVLRLVDFTFGGGGFIKGERVIAVLRELVGNVRIEDLPVTYTAVATDLDKEREVWLSHGPLFDAIRASIAIPGVFTPVVIEGHTLVDGGLLNPLPMAATLHAIVDLTVAVNVNAPVERLAPPHPAPLPMPQPAAPTPVTAVGDLADPWAAMAAYRSKVMDMLDGLIDRRAAPERPLEPGWREMLMRSLETMQGAITRLRLATHTPDLLINIPHNAAAVYEFHRAEELIELGRERAEAALAGLARKVES